MSTLTETNKHKLRVHDKGAVWHAASQYQDDPMRVLYEFVKNHKQAGADEITIEVNTKKNWIAIYGNGSKEKLDAIAMHYIRQNIFNSSRGAYNHGFGLFTFLILGSNLDMIGKVEDKYYLDTYNSNVESEYEDPIEMDKAKQAENKGAISRIKNYKNGSIWIIGDIGNAAYPPKYDFRFKLEEVFDERKMKHFLTRNTSFISKKIKIFLCYDGKTSRITEPKRTGKNVKFSIPSKTVDIDEKEISFQSHNNGENPGQFIVVADFNLFLTNGTLYISQDGMDAVDLRQQRGFRRGASFYKSESYPLSGTIDFHIESLNDSEVPSFYTGDRNNILWATNMGRSLENILMRASLYLRPILEEHMGKQQNDREKKWGERLTLDLHSFLKNNLNFFDIHHTGETHHEYKLKCKQCGTENPDYNESDEMYVCKNCGKSWAKRKYGRTEEPAAPPVRHPKDTGTKPRDRLKGRLGYNVHFEPSTHYDEITTRSDLDIYINTAHSVWIKSGPAERKRLICDMVLSEIITHRYGHLSGDAFLSKIKKAFCLSIKDGFGSSMNLTGSASDEKEAVTAVKKTEAAPVLPPKRPGIVTRDDIQKLQEKFNS